MVDHRPHVSPRRGQLCYIMDQTASLWTRVGGKRVNDEEMIAKAIEKIKTCSDETLQAVWDHLCASFFLADTAKKADLVAYPVERQRQFLQGYARDLLQGKSYVEQFWRFVVKEEVFEF